MNEMSMDALPQIVGSVFEMMIGLEAGSCDIPWEADGDRLTSFVQLAGDWTGAVILECSERQACQFAGMVLGMDPPERADDDVRDVLGELVNMIGGNMKSSMTTGVRLSMPTVADGCHTGLHFCGSAASQMRAFQCLDRCFWVAVVSKEPNLTRGKWTIPTSEPWVELTAE